VEMVFFVLDLLFRAMEALRRVLAVFVFYVFWDGLMHD
jgi:hypothetical protein